MTSFNVSCSRQHSHDGESVENVCVPNFQDFKGGKTKLSMVIRHNSTVSLPMQFTQKSFNFSRLLISNANTHG